jgi:glyoxylase-like metal-dependent hydrolase (beta-lactamase superfamily II)
MTTRREFLRGTGSCAAHLALAAAGLPLFARRMWAAQPAGTVVAQEPFGRLERVADGVWALISTPLTGARTTVCNGGLVAGRSGVLAVEGFMTADGARWLATKARELTGRWPSHCVVTHYHADHANGVAGYAAPGATSIVHATGTTRGLALERNQPADPARNAILGEAVLLDGAGDTSIDLGGRTVRVVPRAGHTASDVTLELDDPSVVFCGDLVWNGMFPNYVDARPQALAASVEALRRTRGTTYVPGHGNVAGAPELARYVAVLAEVEAAARRAHGAGTPPADAARAFRLPEALGEWALFNPAFFERAFAAWARELQ